MEANNVRLAADRQLFDLVLGATKISATDMGAPNMDAAGGSSASAVLDGNPAKERHSRLAVATCILCVLAGAMFGSSPTAAAADNELTPAEKAAGWRLLFDGQTVNGWKTSRGEPSKTGVEQGALNPHGCGAYMLIHEEQFADFQLAIDFKLSPKCNSGIFVRTFPLVPRPGKDVGFNGIEIALDDTMTAGFHDTGAIYDLVAPSKNAMHPVGEWNRAVVTCDKNRIAVEINGQLVTEMDLDQWTRPNQRPDGTEHKFDIAYRDHPRRGFIGLQDHGSAVWFKNIKLRPLPSKEE